MHLHLNTVRPRFCGQEESRLPGGGGGGGMNVRHEKSYLQSSIIDSHTGKKTFERGEGLAEAK